MRFYLSVDPAQTCEETTFTGWFQRKRLCGRPAVAFVFGLGGVMMVCDSCLAATRAAGRDFTTVMTEGE